MVDDMLARTSDTRLLYHSHLKAVEGKCYAIATNIKNGCNINPHRGSSLVANIITLIDLFNAGDCVYRTIRASHTNILDATRSSR